MVSKATVVRSPFYSSPSSKKIPSRRSQAKGTPRSQITRAYHSISTPYCCFHMCIIHHSPISFLKIGLKVHRVFALLFPHPLQQICRNWRASRVCPGTHKLPGTAVLTLPVPPNPLRPVSMEKQAASWKF